MRRILTAVLVSGVLFTNTFPFIWLVFTAFKRRVDIFAIPPALIFSPTLRNFISVFVKKGFPLMFLNSVIIAVGSTILSLVVGSLAAYGLARFKVTGQKHLSFWILSTRMFPPIVLVIPFYIMASKGGLRDTHLLMILVHTTFNLPFVVWIMKGFFKDLPEELEQAAMVDGYSRLDAFRKVIIPVAKPGLVTTGILCLIASWNEFLFANILTGEKVRTLPVGVRGLVTSRAIEWGEIAAVATLLVIPIIVFTYLVQKHIVRGLTLGAVKG